MKDNFFPYDALNQDEDLVISTSFCLFPASICNGQSIGSGLVTGHITSSLQQRYLEKVEYDFVC